MTSERPRAARALLGRTLLASALGGLTACEAPSAGVPVGSNTNWLVSCDESADCGAEGACVCGTCTLECELDLDCSRVPEARCAVAGEAALRSQCRSDAPPLAAGMCLTRCEPGECAAAEACVGGACVVSLPPPVELCDTLPEPNAEARAAQDRLLALLQGLRAAGGVECAGAAASVPVPELRWDARLACAARALATDMARTRSQSLVDSAGRSTAERLALVGYSQRSWGEAFALAPNGEGAALDAMLSDVDSCSRFVSAEFVEVGVGNFEDAYVVTLANE